MSLSQSFQQTSTSQMQGNLQMQETLTSVFESQPAQMETPQTIHANETSQTTTTSQITSTQPAQIQLPLDLEYESCMKQQLLRHAVQQEVDIFMRDPTCIPDLLYLDFIFTQLRTFPLLSSHEKAKEKFEEFILTLPQFLSVSQRASKLDQQNKQLRVLVAGTFQVNFCTPLEKEEADKMLKPSYSRKVLKEAPEGAEPEDNPLDRMRSTYFDKGQHEVAVAAVTMFLDMSQDEGVARFFAAVKSTSKLSDLPPIYQNFLRKVGKMMALNAEKNYTSKDQVSKLKRMYRLTPMQAIKGLLAITNPVKLLAGLLSLFLAKPMGMQSLLQKMVAASTELKRSEKLLKNAKKCAITILKKLGPKVGPELLDHITKYLQTHDLPLPDQEHYKKTDKGFKEVSYESLFNVEFVLDVVRDKVDVTKLQKPELDAIQQVIIHEIRVQEKRELVNMLGTEKIVSIIKEMWTIFDEPIALLCRSNLGTHLERMLKGVKEIVKVSEESKELSIEERLEAYNVVLQRVQDDFYSLVHEIAKRDTGAFQKTLQWYINILKCITGEPLDVQALIRDLPEAEQAAVLAEVHSMVEYQILVQQGQKPMRRPLDPTLCKLVPAFNEMVRTRLPQKASPKNGSEGKKGDLKKEKEVPLGASP